MTQLTFLRAGVPLTKTITPTATLPYPVVKNFSSTDVEVKDLNEFYKTVMAQAKAGACLLKGNLNQVLNNEPRRDHHEKTKNTDWVCFDLDKAPFSDADEFMKAIGLGDVSYIVQFSASYKLKQTKTFSAHIFCMLDQPISAKNLEAWLMHLNFATPVLEKAFTLTDSLEYLHFPLDVVVARNSQIIYIAPPVLKGITDPCPKPTDRIQYKQRKTNTINTATVIHLKPMTTLKGQVRDKINALRVSLNLKPQKTKLKIVGDVEVQPNAAEVDHYEIVEETDEFIRLNIGPNGDSNAYWVFKADFELLRNFKGHPFTYLKDTLPDLFKELTRKQRSQMASMASTGDMVLAVRDKATGQYWKGLFNASKPSLELHTVDSKDKLHDFLQGHGVPPPPFITEWTVGFDPNDTTIVDEDARTINTFIPTQLMENPTKGAYPTIQRFIDHAIGTGEIQEHFMNWLAVILQHRVKTKTAWILHGTQGTGKGVLVNTVLRGIFKQYVQNVTSDNLNSEFNQFMEKTLIAFVDEIDIDTFEKKATENKLRSLVTESPIGIRRMRTDSYDAENYTNFIFASNHPQPVKIPLSDRRYNVGIYQPHRLISTHEEITVTIPSEISGFAHYLLTRKACINTAAQVLKTSDRAAIQALSITSVDELANNILTGNIEALLEAMPDESMHLEGVASVYASLIRSICVSKTDRLTRDQLRVIFEHCIGKVPEGANKFTSFLRHHGIHTKQIKDNGVKTFGISVPWQWATSDTSHLTQQPLKLLRKVK